MMRCGEKRAANNFYNFTSGCVLSGSKYYREIQNVKKNLAKILRQVVNYDLLYWT